MKIGILEAGKMAGKLAEVHGTYPPLYKTLLRRADPSIEFLVVSLVNGELAEDPFDADGWLVSGSRHGVYEDLPWIEPTMQFLRACLAQSVPVVGICFGHQLLAQAMGGKVENSAKGWGLGVQRFDLHASPGWMKGDADSYAGYALHQDQIVSRPANTTVLASNDFCEFAALVYGDPHAPAAITVQSHPEFSGQFIRDLIEQRRGHAIPENASARALETLDQPVDNAAWSRWIVDFLDAAIARRARR